MSLVALQPMNQARPMMPVNKPISEDQKIKAAHDYEEMFLKFFFKEMMPKDIQGGLFGAGHTAEMYQSLLIDALARSAAKRGIGIAEQIIKNINRNNPKKSDPKIGKLMNLTSRPHDLTQGEIYDQYA